MVSRKSSKWPQKEESLETQVNVEPWWMLRSCKGLTWGNGGNVAFNFSKLSNLTCRYKLRQLIAQFYQG